MEHQSHFSYMMVLHDFPTERRSFSPENQICPSFLPFLKYNNNMVADYLTRITWQGQKSCPTYTSKISLFKKEYLLLH